MTAIPRGRNAWITLGGVVLVLVLYGGLPGTGTWARNVAAGTKLLYERRNTVPDTRARALMGDAYGLMMTARKTPPTSRILIPAGAEYAPVSNRIWCAYYLYPRRLVTESELGGPPAGRIDYALVYKGALLTTLGVPADSIRGGETLVYALPGSPR